MAPGYRTNQESDLNISIAAEKHTYHPGELIEGDLILRLPTDSLIGKVSLVFLGEARSKISQPNGQSISSFTSAAHLFRFERILQDDHFTHKSGNHSWPFKFDIPDAIAGTDVTGKWIEHENFLANIFNNSVHSVPISFDFGDSENAKRYEVAVNYTLEAIVAPPTSANLFRQQARIFTKPITVAPRPSAEPIDLSDPRHRQGQTKKWTIKTLHLLPEDLDSRSLLQLTKARLQPSTWPKFTIDIDISYPSAVQLLHPDTIPFILSVRPDTNPNLTTIQPTMQTFYRYPTVHVKRFQLMLKMTTECRCYSLLRDAHAGSVREVKLANRRFQALSMVMTSVAWDQKNRVEDDSPPMIDLGRECEIRLGKFVPLSAKNGTKSHDQQLGLTPSLRTYNISRSYHLAWTIELECAREKIIVKDRSAKEIRVLSPAKSMQDGAFIDESAIVLGFDNEDWLHNHNLMRDDRPNPDESIRRPSNRDTLPAYSELPGLSTTSTHSTPQRSEKSLSACRATE